MAQSKPPKKLYNIAQLTTKLKHWKIKVKVNRSLIPNDQQKSFRTLKGTGKLCAYLLEDQSAEIRIFALCEDAERLESIVLQMNDQEHFIWGAEIRKADKNYHRHHNYELKFNKYTVIERADGEPVLLENGTSASHTSIAQTTGPEETKRRKVQFEPIPLKEVLENGKSRPPFDVLGIIKKSSVPDPKQHETSQYFVKNMRLIDTTGEVDISVMAKKKIDLKKITELKNEVIGLVGCVWKEFDLVYSAQFKNLIEEKDLPQSVKAKIQKLKEWAEQQPKQSPKKEKKSLHESAVGDPVQDPEIMPSKKRTIESNMPLTRSKAKSMTLLRPTTGHLFSKGEHNQKEVLPSIVRAEVSKSVGLIHIDRKAKGTGFRVGEKYIVTCAHVMKDAISAPHFIDSGRASIEFGRTSYNKKEDPNQIFSIIDLKLLDLEYDFAVLELGIHDSGVPFPPALTCFGMVCCTEVHLVGHPNNRQMMEDSVIPYWLPEHSEIILPCIKECGDWSKGIFPDGRDYYEELSYLPRKIMFHTTFNPGSSGSPGVVIKDEKPCVVLMVRGGVPGCIYYDGQFPDYAPKVEDHRRIEYGYAMQDINEKMRNSSLEKDRNLALEIFKTWKC